MSAYSCWITGLGSSCQVIFWTVLPLQEGLLITPQLYLGMTGPWCFCLFPLYNIYSIYRPCHLPSLTHQQARRWLVPPEPFGSWEQCRVNQHPRMVPVGLLSRCTRRQVWRWSLPPEQSSSGWTAPSRPSSSEGSYTSTPGIHNTYTGIVFSLEIRIGMFLTFVVFNDIASILPFPSWMHGATAMSYGRSGWQMAVQGDNDGNVRIRPVNSSWFVVQCPR